MNSNKKVGRIIGALFLIEFVTGIVIFQFLQGSVLFSDNYLVTTSENSNEIIASVVLGIFSGVGSLLVATLLLPIFKRHSVTLAYLYFAFCILNFVAMMIDNVSVLSMLELSREYVKNGNDGSIQVLKELIYQKHWWTHYLYLLISCLPVFVLYFTFYVTKLVPRIISIFGMMATVLMFTEEVLSIFGHGVGMNMLLPMALIQLVLPLWLIYKGLNSPSLQKADAL